MAKDSSVFGFIRYANVWEDTDVAICGLGIKAEQTGAVVCSGGDNVLAMLAFDPSKIYAFDINKTQLFVLELKMAAMRSLELFETRTLLGVEEGERVELYRRVRGDMSREARKYFDEHLELIEKGIIHAGKFEHYFQLFRKYIIPLTSSKKNYVAFSRMKNTKAQKDFYERKINTWRFRALFRVFFGAKSMAKNGRDKTFFKYVDANDVKTNGTDLKKKVEFGLFHTQNAENPYFDYIANGNFTHAFPQYLRPEYYEKVRDNLDKVELVYGGVNNLPNMKFDFCYLSDIFEYMSEAEFLKNVEKVKRRVKKGGRILYWNMQNRRYIKDDGFVFDEELSRKLFRENKTWFYRDLLIYEVRK